MMYMYELIEPCSCMPSHLMYSVDLNLHDVLVLCRYLSLAAVIFRYNLVSFSYLLLLLIIFLLPGPRLKSQKGWNIIAPPPSPPHYLPVMQPRLECTTVPQQSFGCTTSKIWSLLHVRVHGNLYILCRTDLIAVQSLHPRHVPQ